MTISLIDLLSDLPSDTRDCVVAARNRFNKSVREYLRQETGLLLNRSNKDADSDESVAVPVQVTAAIPETLKTITFDDSQRILTLISQYRADLVQLRASLPQLQKLLNSLRNTSHLIRGSENVWPVQVQVEHLLAALEESDPARQILSANEDVLGCYRYSRRPYDPLRGQVELYWAVIGLVAKMLGKSVEILTVIVLIHELAHAYTHLGADIDGERWGTDAFADAESALKEGLAQYYTAAVCRRLEDRLPGITEVFDYLTTYQPEIYSVHQNWQKQKYSPEEIRLAMLEVRRAEDGRLAFFMEAIEKARLQLHRRPRQQDLF